MPTLLAEPHAVRSGILRQIWASRADYLYVLPAIVVMLVVIAYPIYYTVDLSFFKTPPGLQLRDKILRRRRQLHGHPHKRRVLARYAQHSDLDAGLHPHRVLSGLCTGAGIASRVRQTRRIARHLHHPVVISAVGASYIWKWIYHSDFGLIGVTLVQWGFTDRPPNFIDSVNTVLPTLIVINISREFPFAMIMLMAGLQTVPEQLLRAAQVDGASAWQRFWHVASPHIRGVSTVTILLLAVANFNSFIIPYHDGWRSLQRLPHLDHAYLRARLRRQLWGVASAYFVTAFFILMTFGYFYVRALSGGKRGEAGA